MARRYSHTPFIQNPETKKRQYETTFYPQVTPRSSDIYVVTVRGDRLDNLAFEYYGDASLWWVISMSNNISSDSIFITPGTQIRVPTDISGVMDQFQRTNTKR